MGRLRVWALLVGAIVLAAAAWPGRALAGGGGGGPCSGFASGAQMVLRDSCFDGVAHFVDAGTTLVVRNDGGLPHSYTAVDGSFDTGVLNSGQSAKIPLKATGIVRVYCSIHGTAQGHGMSGILVIGSQAAATAGQGQTVEAVSSQRDADLLGELQAQSKVLAELKTEVADVKQSVAANAATNAQTSTAGVLGLVGILLGGGALGVVLTGRARAPKQGGEEKANH